MELIISNNWTLFVLNVLSQLMHRSHGSAAQHNKIQLSYFHEFDQGKWVVITKDYSQWKK